MKSKGGVHSDQMVLGTVGRRLDRMSGGHRHSKTKLSSRGATRFESTDQMVLVLAR